MPTITTKQAPPKVDSLCITDFSYEEQLALLAILGNIRLTSGSPVKSIVKKLEAHFTDDQFEEAFEEFDFNVYMDGSLLDPHFVELELCAK